MMEDLAPERNMEILTPSVPKAGQLASDRRRRSHLKSETFSTLVRILTLCANESQTSRPLPVVPDARDQGVVHNKDLEIANLQGAHNKNSTLYTDSMYSESNEAIYVKPSSSSVEKDMIVENIVASDNNAYDLLELSQTAVKEHGRDEGIEIVGQCLQPETAVTAKHTDGMGNEHLNSESLEVTKLPESTQVALLALEQNLMEELGDEMQQTENGLRMPDSMEIDKEIEDGEIIWDADLSFDTLLEDSALMSEMKLCEEQTPGDLIKQKECLDACMDQKRIDETQSASTSSPVSTTALVNNYVAGQLEQRMREGEFESRTIQKAYGDDWLFENSRNSKQRNKTKGPVKLPLTYPVSLRLPVDISEEVMSDNQGILPSDKEIKVPEKKKRGPATKERKAKKKIKERKRRAARERQQGVKRLRIEPMSKPKVVKYCDFYLNGRCQKGDTCKFSHDTTPLTKSQPCKFLAVQSCLKGDACPFDHQLSKYPCNNYVSKGYCSRGDKCLFSHKPVESPSPSNISQTDPGSNPGPVSGNTNSTKPHTSKNASYQAPHNLSKETTARTPSSSGGNPGRFKAPAQPPKGITFLSFGNSPLDRSSTLEQFDIPHNNKESDSNIGKQKDHISSEKSHTPDEPPRQTPGAASPLDLSQSSNPLPSDRNKNTVNSAEKLLMSTLSFAAKYESEKKMSGSNGTPTLSSAEPMKTPQTDHSSGSVNVQQASLLQEFLFGFGGD